MYLAFRVIAEFDWESSKIQVMYLGRGTKTECEHLSLADAAYHRCNEYTDDPIKHVEDDDVYLSYTGRSHNEDYDVTYPTVTYLVIDESKPVTLVRDWMYWM